MAASVIGNAVRALADTGEAAARSITGIVLAALPLAVMLCRCQRVGGRPPCASQRLSATPAGGPSPGTSPSRPWASRPRSAALAVSGSTSAEANSKQTLLCTCLYAVLLIGLLLNATLGWS